MIPELKLRSNRGPELNYEKSEVTSARDDEFEGDDGGVDLDGTFISAEGLQVQVEQVGEVVQMHDLGRDDLAPMNVEDDVKVDRERRYQLPADGTSLIKATAQVDPAKLLDLTHTEVTQLVTTLQKDKDRLHRLVIAQHAAIDSERKSNDRSRSVARDAIKIMRDARLGQKRAEKIARREWSERKRLEKEYSKVSYELENARSVIAARRNSLTD